MSAAVVGGVVSVNPGVGINPFPYMDHVFDTAGIVYSGSAVLGWTASKGGGVLSSSGSVALGSVGGVIAPDNTVGGGRLGTSPNLSPVVAPTGGVVTYVFGGRMPLTLSGDQGFSGNDFSGNRKPFPVAISGSGNWDTCNSNSGAARDRLKTGVSAWNGKKFFAVIRQSLAPTPSRMTIVLDGVATHLNVAPSANLTGSITTAGFTILGYAVSGGNWNGPWAYLGIKSGDVTDSLAEGFCEWGKDLLSIT